MRPTQCKECGRWGQCGLDIVPYNFPGRVTRWLCDPTTGRKCVEIRYERMRAHFREVLRESRRESIGDR
jgi:hypothetical protein